MPVVAIKCLKCGVKLGVIDNIWLRLGNERIALITDANTDLEIDFDDPDHEKLDVTGINSDLTLEVRHPGDVRIGSKGTFVQDSKFRDIVCASCTAPLGLQIVEAHPENQALAKGQYIFFTRAIVLKSTKDGRRKVEPEIQQVFHWVDSRIQFTQEQPQSASPLPSEDELQGEDSDQEQEEPEDQAEDMDEDLPQEHLLDPEVAAALRSVVSAYERDIKLLYDELRGTKADVKKLKTENERLKTELEETKDEAKMAHRSAEEAKSNVSLFKGDIQKLVNCLENYQVQHSSPAPGSSQGARNLKRSSLQGSDDSVARPSKRVAATPEVSSAANRRISGTGNSQRSSPIVSSASRLNGLLTRPARRSSGIWGKELHDQDMDGTDDA